MTKFVHRLPVKDLDGFSTGLIGVARFASNVECLPAGRPNCGISSSVRSLHSTRPAYGVFDSFKETWANMKDNQVEEKKQELFSAQV